jgi:hypothetical protein
MCIVLNSDLNSVLNSVLVSASDVFLHNRQSNDVALT